MVPPTGVPPILRRYIQPTTPQKDRYYVQRRRNNGALKHKNRALLARYAGLAHVTDRPIPKPEVLLPFDRIPMDIPRTRTSRTLQVSEGALREIVVVVQSGQTLQVWVEGELL